MGHNNICFYISLLIKFFHLRYNIVTSTQGNQSNYTALFITMNISKNNYFHFASKEYVDLVEASHISFSNVI